MSKRLIATKLMIATMVAMPAAAVAQEWVPGSEIVGQSIVVETNGVANTVYFDAGGAARIISPSGRVVNASWTAANRNLCLNSGAASECWPYAQAFQAGQRVTLTSNCQAVSSWSPNGVNQQPVQAQNMGERG
ncbi:hypothetical protein [Sphingomonas sp.]|uniref:hypothetical protein n=1 Tax=Sphingomonas sp. TaxID=28214 RepID=UPI00286C130A|nr:hypothetical protein [Sphingomonas sp.]